MRKNRKKNESRQGFTLIELLIVIGLLGALTALILPSLTAQREDAIGDVCDYNQAGTLRVLTQYYDLFGKYPKDLHNGLNSATADYGAIDGLPDFQAVNMITNKSSTIVQLSTNQAASLAAAGITSICSSNGFHSTTVAADVYVSRCTTNWVNDENNKYTFNGLNIAAWEAASGTPSWDTANGAGIVVTLWVTPTTDWSEGGAGDNNYWTKGAVNMGISLAGQCPVPVNSTKDGVEPDFAYYMAYFKVYDNLDSKGKGIPARLIGTSCPECGVLNP